MNQKPLGPEGPRVSVVGFGGMPLSIRERPDEATAIGVIHAALEAGMTLIDTADVYCLDESEYGHNERLVRKALGEYGGAKGEIVVATKGGMTRSGSDWGRDGRPERLRRSCERSLRALGVDTIDLYQFHAVDPNVPFEESVGALADLRKEGKIRLVGLSNVSVDQIETAEEIVPVATVQNRLNPFFREAIDDGVVACCDRKGIGFLAYSPVGGGRLNRKLPGHPVVAAIADETGAKPHEVALAWVLSRGKSVIIIPGARTAEHARSSVAAERLELTEDQKKAIEDAEFSIA